MYGDGGMLVAFVLPPPDSLGPCTYDPQGDRAQCSAIREHQFVFLRGVFHRQSSLGIAWVILWLLVARPPFLPKLEKKATKLTWPNLGERRLWSLVFSYALPAIAPGPILTLLSVYLNQGLGVAQADLRYPLLVPP